MIREDSADERRARGEHDRRRRAREARREARVPTIRKAVGVVVALAIVAIVGAIVLRDRQGEDATPTSSPTTTPTAAPSGATSTTDDGRGLGYERFHAGDCLIWDQRDETSFRVPVDVISCDEPHLMEMVTARIISSSIESYPESFEAIFDELCAADVGAYLGGPLDPHGRFFVTGLKPTRPGWNAGDRNLLCGVGRYPSTAEDYAKPDDELLAARGSSVGTSQDRLFAEGSCMRGDPFEVVRCYAPHDWEITATIVLADQPTIPAPDDRAGWSAIVGDRCHTAAITYLGRTPSADLTAGWSAIEPESWALGRRSLQCTVSRTDDRQLTAPSRGVTA